MAIELTSGQAELLERATKWYRDYWSGNRTGYEHPQWFAYSGASGCGKTTVAKVIIDHLNLGKTGYIGCAYTGKAVLQMQKNRLNAKTIHSLIYNIIPVIKRDPVTKKRYMSFEFELKKKLDNDYQLIIVDEAPMVNDEIIGQLMSFNIPILFMGDMNQLPPVFGSSSIMLNPDYTLTQIMRQKENDPIVQLSQMILKGIPLIEGEYGKSKVLRSLPADERLLTDYDQILCTTNRLRTDVNSWIRSNLLGRPTLEPSINDKIICRQNNWLCDVDGYYLVNGLSGYITDISRDMLHRGYYLINFHPDFFPEGLDFLQLKMDSKYIKASLEDQKRMPRIQNEKFEYAYAITVHLSQGSEYPSVLFLDTFFQSAELTRRAEYTAITRAQEAVTIIQASPARQKRYFATS